MTRDTYDSDTYDSDSKYATTTSTCTHPDSDRDDKLIVMTVMVVMIVMTGMTGMTSMTVTVW